MKYSRLEMTALVLALLLPCALLKWFSYKKQNELERIAPNFEAVVYRPHVLFKGKEAFYVKITFDGLPSTDCQVSRLECKVDLNNGDIRRLYQNDFKILYAEPKGDLVIVHAVYEIQEADSWEAKKGKTDISLVLSTNYAIIEKGKNDVSLNSKIEYYDSSKKISQSSVVWK